MNILRLISAAILSLVLVSQALAFDRPLPNPIIKDNGDVHLSDDLKIGRLQGSKYIATPDSLQIQGPGSTGPIDGMSVTLPGAGAVSRAITEKLRDLPVYPQDYGAKCNGSFNDQPGYQKAADVATATGRALHVGGENLCVLNETINLTKAISIIGDGQHSSVLVGLHNGPIFTWTVNGTDVNRFVVRDFSLRGQYGATADYSASRGFLIQGDSTAWFQIGNFQNLLLEGFYAGFEFTKGTFTSSFGQESRTGFIGFDGIYVRNASRLAVYGWLWRNGSGTGQTYTNVKSAVNGPGGALLRFEGAGAVVGDIVFVGGHVGGAPGSKLISVGPGTVYRSNISIVGSQLDAGMDVPFEFDPSGPVFQRILFSGNNVGGGVSLGANLPPLVTSIIDDQEVSSWRAGVSKGPISGGAQTLPLFAITLGDLYTGTECSVTASGLVVGVAGGATRAGFLFGRSGSDPVIAAVGSPSSTTPAAGFFSIVPSVVAGTTRVVVGAAFSPSESGSRIEAQIRCSGGEFKVERL